MLSSINDKLHLAIFKTVPSWLFKPGGHVISGLIKWNLLYSLLNSIAY